MAISRLQAALAAVTNDVTVAAANINFDFTLVKCEAPKEYHDLGKALSSNRKDEAELGQTHITARRLGALFEGICPPTPKLIKAYGLRVSEIAGAAGKSSTEPSNSIFAAYSGVDGTSIWAAATSSPTALHVQLLACMLARVWPAPEATSVWYELVKDRRKDISKRYEHEEAIHFSTLTAAAQANISRTNLAEWDASARAWLRTADRVKSTEQHQLMLVIANVNIPINRDMVVYSSVTAAWKSALESMEKLISGMPQAVNSGPTLLALSSWHLYPDILAVGQKSTEIRFNDQLVATGGVLTVGLAPSENSDGRGVYWSLSLAHLNYYGKPVNTNGLFDEASERLSFSEFALAVFGCVMATWNLHESKIEQGARLFIAMQEFAERALNSDRNSQTEKQSVSNFLRHSTHWWNIMAAAARSYLEASDEEKESVQRLVWLGCRRSTSFFLPLKKQPFFDLSNPSLFVKLLRGNEEKIKFLRMIASSSSVPGNCLILIRYSSHENNPQYATAFPAPQSSHKRKRKGQATALEYRHQRWVSHATFKTVVDGELWSGKGNYFADYGLMGSSFDVLNEQTGQTHVLVPVYGNINDAAICQDGDVVAQYFRPPTAEDIIWGLDNDAFSVTSLLNHLDKGLDPLAPVNAAICAMSAAATIYKAIPTATVSVKTLNQALSAAKWTKSSRQGSGEMWELVDSQRETIKLDRPTALSCIAYMEAGFDIEPSLLASVFALAFEDSLYIGMQLVCDPCEMPASYELKRILGNVGRPGVSLLIPPRNPMLRSINPSSWKVVSTTLFNGMPEDHFGSTSLHLSFTEYYVPLYQNSEQGQDSQIYFLESVVSVHDSGQWVGDINILEAFENSFVNQLLAPSCDHPEQTDQSKHCSTMVSAERWDDVLDPPSEAFVIRANGNWIARLATTAMLTQILPKGSTGITICPLRVCWKCNDPRQGKSQLPGLTKVFIY